MEVNITKLDQNSTTSSKKNRPKNEETQRERVNLQPLYDESTLQSERSRKSQNGGRKKSEVDEENEKKLNTFLENQNEEELKKSTTTNT
jgi:hypothetical protein